jgi:hypothetical protein
VSGVQPQFNAICADRITKRTARLLLQGPSTRVAAGTIITERRRETAKASTSGSGIGASAFPASRRQYIMARTARHNLQCDVLVGIKEGHELGRLVVAYLAVHFSRLRASVVP